MGKWYGKVTKKGKSGKIVTTFLLDCFPTFFSFRNFACGISRKQLMKRDLKSLFALAGTKMTHPGHMLAEDFEHLSALCSKHHVNLSGQSLKKLWELATGKRKLSKEAKDRLALFAGFQSWNDLDDALHGNADASINYADKKE